MSKPPVIFNVLKGTIIQSIDIKYEEVRNSPASHVLTFTTAGGRTFRCHHNQDCVESVYLVKIIGDPGALIGNAITLAEDGIVERPEWAIKEVIGHGDPTQYGSDSETWTVFRLGARDAVVEFWWLGSSNGYYNEEVDFCELEKETP